MLWIAETVQLEINILVMIIFKVYFKKHKMLGIKICSHESLRAQPQNQSNVSARCTALTSITAGYKVYSFGGITSELYGVEKLWFGSASRSHSLSKHGGRLFAVSAQSKIKKLSVANLRERQSDRTYESSQGQGHDVEDGDFQV